MAAGGQGGECALGQAQAAGGDVLGEVAEVAGPGDGQDVGALVEGPRQPDLGRAHAVGAGDGVDFPAVVASRSANELINRAPASYPDELVIATTVGPVRDPSGQWLPHAAPEQLRGQIEENLRQLGRDHLAVVNLRIVGTGSIAERFGALAELREAGLVRHLGLSNVRPHHLAEAQNIAPVVCVPNMYGIGASPEQKELLDSLR